MTGAAPPGPVPELAHFGAVSAGLAHELNNALATTQAAAGLIDDYCAMIERGREVAPDKLAVAAQRVERSLRRGLQLVDLLHWFAHSIDEPSRPLQLAELVDRVVLSAAVPARRAGATVEVDGDGLEGLALRGSEFELHHVVYRTLTAAFGVAATEAIVLVGGAPAGPDHVEIQVAVDRRDEAADLDGELAACRPFAEQLGGTLTAAELEPPVVGLVLRLPRERSQRDDHPASAPRGDAEEERR